MNTNAQPVSILIAALGGEGGGVLTEWLVAAAARAGFAAQSTSIPGVAQRTGATTYYVEIYPVPLAELDGRVPGPRAFCRSRAASISSSRPSCSRRCVSCTPA